MNQHIKKIIISIPCLLLGGTEIATLAMIRALIRSNYHVILICYYEHDYSMIKRFESIGTDIKLLNLKRGGIKSLLKLLFILINLFNKLKPDVIHVQYLAPGMIPIFAAKASGIKNIFATIHASGKAGFGFKAKIMFRISAFLSDHFFCVSKNVEKFWFGETDNRLKQNLFNTDHSVIYNCVNMALFNSDVIPVQIKGLTHDNITIGIIGRVVHLKGHDILLKSISLLIKKYPEIKLLIIGNGDDLKKFQTLSKKLELEKCVIWCGSVEPEKLPQYYKAMDIFVMPSRYEGFGLTAIEAMASGVSVIGSNVDGLKEVIGTDNTNGLLFTMGSYKDLSSKIEKLLLNTNLRKKIIINGKNRVNKLFSLKQHDAKWQKTYNALIK
jgi:L-malate glycosyltransferase